MRVCPTSRVLACNLHDRVLLSCVSIHSIHATLLAKHHFVVAACLTCCPACLPACLTNCLCLLPVQDLVAECPAAKELFDKAADILGYDLLKVRAKAFCIVY